ncbi:MAG: cysteine--tRNA ligase [bacterium]
MLIYNTLTKKKEEFKPASPPNVTIYMCGPTVYDYFHIGNARSFIMADVIRRYLEYKGYKVKFVMNLTDVDDKIIKKSIQEGISTEDVTAKYISAFFDDVKKLKIKIADVYPKATTHIFEMIELVKTLEEKGMAYNVDGDVFYNVSKFENYGKLSGKNIEELEAGARVEVDERKNSPLDFALWKKTKEGEPYWDSPWGQGRPGWHLECSAMSRKHLGQPIDIHAGGNDLIFPHHENEIAQSEAAYSHPFVNYWIHFGFLNIKEEKMSKSLGNYFTAREILQKYSAGAVRFFFIQTHYAGPLNFSEELLSSAEKGLEKIKNLTEFIAQKLNSGNLQESVREFDFNHYTTAFEKAMDDDFNSSQAIAAIFDFVKDANKFIVEANPGISFYDNAKDFLQKTASDVFGIVDFNIGATPTDSSIENELITLLLNLRMKAKKEKNFTLADEIRVDLAKLGIVLKDTKDGTTYKKESVS